MAFNSFDYIIFLGFVLIGYKVLPGKWRISFLVLASYFYYMSWRVEYIFLILISTLVGYVGAIQIDRCDKESFRFRILLLVVSCHLGLLFFFKYYNFFRDSFLQLFPVFNGNVFLPPFDVLLPIGISFYTFQVISYNVDVYRRQQKVERHLGKFALYVSYFPQLIAGPIERASRLMPQLFKATPLTVGNFSSGGQRVLWGLFKKMVVADRLGTFVDPVYANPSEYSSLMLAIATLFFAFQIYYDFSGYTDIALGSARMFGIKLMENFDNPFRSKSISEFWRRWHISLSSWVNDYIHKPLSLNLRAWGLGGILTSTMITFLLLGLWHGANWTFVVFGFLHGTAICIEILGQRYLKKLNKRFIHVMPILSVVVTFIFYCFSLIFFRADSMQSAFTICLGLVQGVSVTLLPYYTLLPHLLTIVLVVFVECFQGNKSFEDIHQELNQASVVNRWAFYYILLFAIIFIGDFEHYQFIYFQF